MAIWTDILCILHSSMQCSMSSLISNSHLNNHDFTLAQNSNHVDYLFNCPAGTLTLGTHCVQSEIIIRRTNLRATLAFSIALHCMWKIGCAMKSINDGNLEFNFPFGIGIRFYCSISNDSYKRRTMHECICMYLNCVLSCAVPCTNHWTCIIFTSHNKI